MNSRAKWQDICKIFTLCAICKRYTTLYCIKSIKLAQKTIDCLKMGAKV